MGAHTTRAQGQAPTLHIMTKSTRHFTLDTLRYSLTIGWLYPDLMSIYGDRGNIICLTNRCEWRGIKVVVKPITLGSPIKDLQSVDFIFAGGAQDSQQTIVSEDLKNKSKILQAMIENGIPGLYICGAYQFLGKYYKESDGTIIDGLGIFDLYTENPGPQAKRLIGNVAAEIQSPPGRERTPARQGHSGGEAKASAGSALVGFENHGGRTYLGKNIKPLATVIKGFGNNGEDKTEGAHYKNSFGSYFHGPILPKNPHFADYLIKLALEKKYGERIELENLDDTLAWQAHNAILRKII